MAASEHLCNDIAELERATAEAVAQNDVVKVLKLPYVPKASQKRRNTSC